MLLSAAMTWYSPPMNYRHAFHAGGFADVIKHIVLVRILTLSAGEAGRVSRHRHPCRRRPLRSHRRRGAPQRRMADRHRAADAGAVLGRRAAAGRRPISTSSGPSIRRGELKAYPGSPLIARALLRPQDRLTACEVEAERAQAPDRCAAPRHPGPRGRPRRLDGAAGLRAAERAARPGADRSAVRGQGRVRTAGGRLCGGLREMADRQLSALVSGEKPPRHRRRWRGMSPRPRPQPSRAGKCLRLEFSVAPQRDRQPAWSPPAC